jgi:hypothetical protein
MEGWRDREG